MREQRANLVATIVTAATLAGAVPAALLALGGAFGPVSWPQPDGRAGSAAPLRLPSPPARPRHPATIRPAPRLPAATIISAGEGSTGAVNVVAAVPRALAIPTLRRVAASRPHRTTSSPRRLVAERRPAGSSHLTSRALQAPIRPPAPQPAPASSGPTASTAAITQPTHPAAEKAKGKDRKEAKKQKHVEIKQVNAAREPHRQKWLSRGRR